MVPTFIIATELRPHTAEWAEALAQLHEVREASARILGFDPDVSMASMRGHPGDAEPAASLRHAIGEAALREPREMFVLPAALDFSLWQRELLGQLLGEARREHPHLSIHHDDVDLGHPLLVSAFAERIGAAMAEANVPAQRCGLILATGGDGDPASRAQSYRLMRLLWEELGLARAEVGFVRHAQSFLAHVLERCAREKLRWLILPQAQWKVEHVEYAKVMLGNLRLANAEAEDWRLVDPPGAHGAFTAWFTQRIVRLWREKRERDAARIPSAKNAAPETDRIWNIGPGLIAKVPDRDAMRETLVRILPVNKPERILVKVTWHGYATGTYTDPAALDLLLGALPAPAIVLEGHTSSRNLGGAGFDWETEARENRAWIRQQEAEYLRRTGLAEVLARHHAQYVNVTEAWWDEECACRCEIERALAERIAILHHTELASFIPRVLLQFRGCPMLSYSKMKGPTRLGISNMFGLIPMPLRSAWHGPNITWFARVCCDVAKLYGSLFDLCGVVEGLFSAVRWNRQGLYRSRWGNYDLITNAGYVAASRGLVPADILASRVQGQDMSRSAFFDVVRQELGWDKAAAGGALPEEIQRVFA